MMRCNMARRKPAPGSSRMYALAFSLLLALQACGGGSSPSPAPTPVDPGGAPGPVLPGCSLSYPVAGSASKPGVPDPKLGEQWHLQSATSSSEGIGASAAWALGATGDGIRVAIIDGPIDTTHEDYAANAAAGGVYDYRLRSASAPLPCTSNESHGTAVAGIIAAVRNNGLGGAGVAPSAKLAFYNPISTDKAADVADIADALGRDSTVNDIYHSSWGSPDNGQLHTVTTAIETAVSNGLLGGRNGLGALYVFAAGNGGCLRGGACTNRDMAAFDGYLNLPGVIPVCAVNRAGALPSTGEEGENLLVCGLAGGGQKPQITTTSVQHAYRADFDGTSAAAPMVSGVIALMLSARPTLSWRDVRLILAATARENQPADTSWESTALPRWGLPGVMKRFSRKFGFGVVDAEAAVRAAREWTSVGATGSLKQCSLESNRVIMIADPVDESILWQSDSLEFTAQQCGFDLIETVEVRLTAEHQYSGDLRVRLLSPSLRASQLADERTCLDSRRSADDCRPFQNWRLTSNRHVNESPAGAWTLQVADAVPGKTGRLTGWSIKLSGRSSRP